MAMMMKAAITGAAYGSCRGLLWGCVLVGVLFIVWMEVLKIWC